MNSEATSQEALPEYKKKVQWTPGLELSLMSIMKYYKPFGQNKFLNIMIVQENIRKELNIIMPFKFLMKYVFSKWHAEAVDDKFLSHFNISQEPFKLSVEYDELVTEKLNEMKKKKVEDGINNKIKNRKLFSGPRKTNFKSVSSSNLKAGPSSSKVSKKKLEKIPSIRRSLRTYKIHEKKKLQGSTKIIKKLPKRNKKTCTKKVTDLKKPKNKIQNQPKDLKKKRVSIVKKKTYNLSLSSSSSYDSKQSLNDNLTYSNTSDDSSRSVTPKLLRSKTSNQSVSPETNSIKKKLRSSDKTKKPKFRSEKKVHTNY
ncbi:Hypothetical protein CINCED_3A024841 [Cinara cedri]|uniref:Uncharacterized protein n=1 Tax=Cinara cedri TaxID=506608 RepID=A0A5E4MNZ5_9HEMI|nr:Hypothetical protein CINCED_3A024841 [Cinara cedri]